jgi:hypothetical protein
LIQQLLVHLQVVLLLWVADEAHLVVTQQVWLMVVQAALAAVLAREITNNLEVLELQVKVTRAEILETRAVIHILPLVAGVLEPLAQALLQVLFLLLLPVKAVMVLFLQFLGHRLLMLEAVAAVAII